LQQGFLLQYVLMFQKIKRAFYFPVASYFRFWARIQLRVWNPRIIVITGSSGKTTLLHLIEAQLDHHARYSHKANSSFGIPFDILGLNRKTLSLFEWPMLFFLAPSGAFKKPYKEKLYVVEVDSDRPGEGKFLGKLLRPEIVIWLSSGRTHSMNFDSSVQSEKFSTIEDAVANEFGHVLECCQRLAIINADNLNIIKQTFRTKAKIVKISKKNLKSYIVDSKTHFKTTTNDYLINALLPRESFYSIEASQQLLDDLDLPFDPSFKRFSLPPGRCSVFKGIKNTTLIDSSYNATPDGMKAIIDLFSDYQTKTKWMVISDMLELGNEEKEEHEKLGELLNTQKINKLVMVGPRMIGYSLPKITTKNFPVTSFEQPKDALLYLKENLAGGETILFKGARFLEGIIEHLLNDKEDVKKLCRREAVWQKRRKQWGL